MGPEESISQWLGYCDLLAKYLPDAANVDLDGVAVRWLNVRWPSMNACIVHTPVFDQDDLDRRIAAASEFAADRDRKWVFVTCDELVPECVRPGWREAPGGFGMVAEHVLPPSTSQPRLEYRAVADAASQREVADLNALVWDLPSEWGREILEPYGGFGEDAFGSLAYLDGRVVSCAVTFLIDERLHVGWVATHPDYRKRGFGEAVVRESLRTAGAASGSTRATLRSTLAGKRLYERIGFRTVAVFRYWIME
jgi:ribosomal protein S18 acetylase RimI-like enzyme